MKSPRFILIIIIISQFCCTSLWFAGNAVMEDLINDFGLSQGLLGGITIAVQLGFITGTLLFAILAIADRFSPSKVFFICAILGAVCNTGIILGLDSQSSILTVRFLTGFFLAGIYPVGMKIAADHFDTSLAKSLGWLVGALVLGTALPHLLKVWSVAIDWQTVILSTSGIAVVGGLLMLFFVPDGAHRKASQKLDFHSFKKVFKKSDFRKAAYGYFGHMWELYAFWTFIPVLLLKFKESQTHSNLNIALWSFFIIAIGSVACVFSGILAQKFSAKTVAKISLVLSGSCCLIFPLAFFLGNDLVLLVFLLIWGAAVIADSPLFSTMVANNCDPRIKGSALTLVNCIGFFITICSIQLISTLNEMYQSMYVYLVLGLGPLFGVIALLKTNSSLNK